MSEKDNKLEHGRDLLTARADFEERFKRGSEFTEELMAENARLRRRVAQLEAIGGGEGDGDDQALIKNLAEKVSRLEGERDKLIERFAEVEAENRDFANRYVEIEFENNNLMNIYVASYQLHSTLDFDEVLKIITEIILNFVGAEDFAVLLLDDKKDVLRPLIVEGVPDEVLDRLSLTSLPIKEAHNTLVPFLANDIGSLPADEPLACVPLTIRDREDDADRTIGFMLIYRFLQQKSEFTSTDHELFSLLAGHAATAIFSAKLYTDSQRKLSTIQGLIDLVAS